MPNFNNFRLITNFLVVLCLCLISHVCDSLRLEVESGSARCISEEIKRDGMTVGKYEVISPNADEPIPDSHRFTARVMSPRGNHYHYKDWVQSGSFAFTARETGEYTTCFWTHSKAPTKIAIDFDWRTGIGARDWYTVARKGKIDLVDVELRRLFDTVQSIHDEMFYLREREEEMQTLNRATKSKMALFSFCSIIIVLSVAVLQLWHLKGYFERKKLL